MSDRLKDLQRQRALAQEQLAWFDQEIAKESGQTPITVPNAPVAPSAATLAPPSAAEAEHLAEEIIARYKNEGTTSPADVKRGCFLYFFFAMGALVIFTAGAYYLYITLR